MKLIKFATYNHHGNNFFGAYKEKGMASFADVLNERDTELVRQFLISRALIDKAEAEALEAAGG